MKRYERSEKFSYCLGMSLTIECLVNRTAFVREVVLSEKAYRNVQSSELLQLCQKNGIPYRYDDRIIEKLSNKENCYCIGFFDKFDLPLQGKDHIVLYGFTDMGELGTTFRSAVSFDHKDIVLIGCDADYFDPACIRASMGSIFHCRIERYDDLQDYLHRYSTQNICALVSKSDKAVEEMSLKSPYSLLISQDEKALDGMFPDSVSIGKTSDEDISLSIRSAIFFEQAFYLKRRR